MEITDELKKQFNRFNAYLLSTQAEDGLTWDYYIYEVDNVEYGHGPYVANNYGSKIDLSKFTTEVKILEEILEHNVNNIDFSDYLECDNCNGSGHLEITYDPSESTLNFELTISTIDTETYDNEISFSKLASEQSPYTWRNYEYLKQFGDQEKINNWREEYGDVIDITYDGAGDSGQINEYEYSQDLEYALYEIIDVYHSGWEINEGSTGEMQIDFKNEVIKIMHNQNIEDSFVEDLSSVKIFE